MNKNTVIPAIAFVAFALIVLAFVPPRGAADPDRPEHLLGVYEGVTVCADCPGIVTRLTLMKDAEYSAEGSYTLSLTYLESDAEPFVSTGLWTTERGTPADPDATVYALDPDMPEKTQRYLRVDADTIRQLDKEGNALPAELPFSLELVAAPSEQSVMPERITIAGARMCLPHKDTSGPQTKECALGLKGDDGKNYALDLANVPLDQSSALDAGRAEITGTYAPLELLSSDHLMKYDVSGVISVESIRPL